MKKSSFIFRLCTAFAALFAAQALSSAHAVVISKANNADALNLASSWTNGVAPGTNDIATWDAALTASKTYSLGADLSWLGMAVTFNPGGNLVFSSGNVLNLGSKGITSVSIDRSITFNNAIALSADQIWHVTHNTFIPAGGLNMNERTLTLSGGATKQFKGAISGGGKMINDGTGTIKFTNAGTAAPTTDVTLNAANLTVETSTGLASVPRTKSLTMNNGGSLTIGGRSGENTVETNANALAVGTGFATVTVSPNAAKNAMLYSGSLVRSADGGVFLFRGTGLGVNPLASLVPNSANVVFGTAPSLVGANGVLGSTTNSILVGAYGDTTSAGNGFTVTGGLVTYDNTYGIRLLNPVTEYTNSISDGQTQLDNVRLTNSSGTANTITLASPTTVNSLSFNVDAAVSPITVEGADLTLNSGTLYARSASPADEGAEMTINSSLNLNSREGIILFSVSGSSDNKNGAKLLINGAIINDGGNGLTISGASGVCEFGGTNRNTYTGATILNGGVLQLRKPDDDFAISGDVVVNGGALVVGVSHQIANTGSLTINGGTVYFADSSNTGSACSETVSNLVMRGGSISYASGRNVTIAALGSANISGAVMPSASGGTFNVTGLTVLHNGGSLSVNPEYDALPSLKGKMTLLGGLVVTNAQQGTYTVANVKSHATKNGGRLALAGDLDFIANNTNLDPAIIATTVNTYPGMVLLNGTRTFKIGDGAASTDFIIQPMITDDGATVGGLIKIGEGALALDGASTFTGGTTVNEGTLTGSGSLASDLTVASGATLAPGTPDAVGTFTVNADVDFVNGSTLDIDISGATADLLVVSGTVTGTVSVPVAQNQADGEWLVMTAAAFTADFVASNPRFALYTRNGGTELWLTKKLGTLILVK